MITLTREKSKVVRLSLNRSVVNLLLQVQLKFNSPTRDEIIIEESLTDLGSGFFTLPLSIDDVNLFKDNSYSYELVQEDESLKVGKVTLLENGENILFDYTLDFLLS